MDKYFTFKFYTEFVIPITIGVIIFVIWLIATIISSVKWNRKISLLEKKGYERYLYDVASVGNGEFYAWRKNNHRITEREMKCIDYKELKHIIANAEKDGESSDTD